MIENKAVFTATFVYLITAMILTRYNLSVIASSVFCLCLQVFDLSDLVRHSMHSSPSFEYLIYQKKKKKPHILTLILTALYSQSLPFSDTPHKGCVQSS